MSTQRQKKRVLIGVAWPYVNGNLHIGHLAGYLLPADICARYNRIVGNDVLMVSGSDCFGTPTTVEADKRCITPLEVVEEYHAKDVELFNDVLNLTYDLYTRTDNPTHAKVSQDIFVSFLEKGYLVSKTSNQYYSSEEKRFLPDRYVEGECPFCHFKEARSDQCDNCGKLINHGELINPVSKLSKSPVELKETEHYFIDWPKLQPQLQKFVEKSGPNWKNWVYKETLGWLGEGLEPRAITRDIDWGVKIPVERIPQDQQISNIEDKRFYVWFEAVIGYLSASVLWSEQGNGDWKKFWYDDASDSQLKHYYFMGKDNLVFHTLFWPGQLFVHDPKLHLPDIPSINQFLNFEGEQFSKSRGVVIDSKKFIQKYGNDAARFYLTLIMPEVRDSSFSWEDFEEKVNGVLVANLGNFIHRSLSLGFGQDISKISENDLWEEVVQKVQHSFNSADTLLDNCEYRNYLDVVLELSSYGNKLVDKEQLWTLKKEDPKRFQEVLKQVYFIIIALGHLFTPVMPHASDKLFKMLDVEALETWSEDVLDYEKLVSKISLSEKPSPLFSKIDIE